MIERQIEFRNDNQILESVNIFLPENWREVTVKNVSSFMNVIKTYNDYKEQMQQLPMPNQPDEGRMREVVFHADMLACLTGLNPEFVQRLSAPVIMNLSEDLKFLKTPPNDSPLRVVIWRSQTLGAINQLKLQIENTNKILHPIKYNKLKAKLALASEAIYEIPKEIGNIALSQWIQSNKIGKEIKKITAEMKMDDYSRLSELLSYILVKKGKGFSMKRQKKNTKIFDELPFEDAFRVSSFFLSMQSSLLKGLRTFITTRMEAKKANQKLKQKED